MMIPDMPKPMSEDEAKVALVRLEEAIAAIKAGDVSAISLVLMGAGAHEGQETNLVGAESNEEIAFMAGVILSKMDCKCSAPECQAEKIRILTTGIIDAFLGGPTKLEITEVVGGAPKAAGSGSLH